MALSDEATAQEGRQPGKVLRCSTIDGGYSAGTLQVLMLATRTHLRKCLGDSEIGAFSTRAWGATHKLHGRAEGLRRWGKHPLVSTKSAQHSGWVLYETSEARAPLSSKRPTRDTCRLGCKEKLFPRTDESTFN